MPHKILRKLFLGFIHIHILHHAAKDPFFGSWMMEELREHGYEISPGTLYPILHSLESNGFLRMYEETYEGKIRKYYSITPAGEELLKEAKAKAYELVKELEE
ncbi:PadR family transcriptional regulator [Alkaliphilus hydrothermalis]|uniref:DNA-binding PadR family transcriptional regulator n=1 Tax=Alkaliphilus hydrothermalis TaxID=1482730 RepID=A0ABS2NT17_9FIRM|nr:PadR family transcriptional regulator [Alkaliphilus hydrothermalis]MBM7616098.1 DNA-binding PadR family transcriptional regulator [Alkaliphilus hydrothermalis]